MILITQNFFKATLKWNAVKGIWTVSRISISTFLKWNIFCLCLFECDAVPECLLEWHSASSITLSCPHSTVHSQNVENYIYYWLLSIVWCESRHSALPYKRNIYYLLLLFPGKCWRSIEWMDRTMQWIFIGVFDFNYNDSKKH